MRGKLPPRLGDARSRREPASSASTEERCVAAVSSSSTHNSNCSISLSRFSLRLPNCKRRSLRICNFSVSISSVYARSSASLATFLVLDSCACFSCNAAYCSPAARASLSFLRRSVRRDRQAQCSQNPSLYGKDGTQIVKNHLTQRSACDLQRAAQSHLDQRIRGAHRVSPIDSLEQHRKLRCS